MVSVVWLVHSTFGGCKGHGGKGGTYTHVMTEMGKIQSVNHTVIIFQPGGQDSKENKINKYKLSIDKENKCGIIILIVLLKVYLKYLVSFIVILFKH